MPSPLLDKATMLRAYGVLAEGLARRRIHADIYVVGGAAMALAWSDRRTTNDIDALFRTNRHHAFLEEVWAVAREMDLPRSWLNVRSAPNSSGRPMSSFSAYMTSPPRGAGQWTCGARAEGQAASPCT
jgi:hypothetical protein